MKVMENEISEPFMVNKCPLIVILMQSNESLWCLYDLIKSMLKYLKGREFLNKYDKKFIIPKFNIAAATWD